MPDFSLLLLDYDGTLAETRPAILRSLSEAFAACGVRSPSYEALEAQLGRGGTLYEFYGAVVSGATAEDAAEFVCAYRACYDHADEEETFLFDAVPETLAALQKAGHRLVVLSNKHAPTLEKSINRFGLRRFFVTSLGAEEHQPRKPDPAVWTKRLYPLFPDVTSDALLMVGDTMADLKFAQNVGIEACWAAYGHGTSETCMMLKPRYCINSIMELVPLLAEVKRVS